MSDGLQWRVGDVIALCKSRREASGCTASIHTRQLPARTHTPSQAHALSPAHVQTFGVVEQAVVDQTVSAQQLRHAVATVLSVHPTVTRTAEAPATSCSSSMTTDGLYNAWPSPTSSHRVSIIACGLVEFVDKRAHQRGPGMATTALYLAEHHVQDNAGC